MSLTLRIPLRQRCPFLPAVLVSLQRAHLRPRCILPLESTMSLRPFLPRTDRPDVPVKSGARDLSEIARYLRLVLESFQTLGGAGRVAAQFVIFRVNRFFTPVFSSNWFDR